MGVDPRDWGVEGQPSPPNRSARDPKKKHSCDMGGMVSSTLLLVVWWAENWRKATVSLVAGVVMLSCAAGPPEQDKDPNCVGARNRPVPCPSTWAP